MNKAENEGGSPSSDSEETSNHNDDTTKIQRFPFWQQCTVGIICCSCQVLFQIAIGMVLGPLPVLIAKFPNLVDLFPVVAGSFMLVTGRLGDLYGHRNMLVVGFAWLSIWSLVTGLSVLTRSSTFFSIARAFQGIGPAFMIPNAAALIATVMNPGRQLNFWMALWGSMVPTGFVLGTVFGGIYAQLAWWPWSFWSLAIASFIATVLALLFIPSSKSIRLQSQWRRIDFLGIAFGIPGLLLVNVAWTRGWQAGWAIPYTYILLIVGSLLFMAFLVVETQVKDPWVRYQDINPRALLLLVSGSCCFGAFGIWLFFSLQYMRDLRHSTPLSVAAQTLPACVAGFISATVFGIAFKCKLPAPYMMVWCTSLFLAANIMLATQPIGQTYWAQMFLSFIFGPLAIDAAVPTCILIFSDLASPRMQGIAMALVNTVINYTIPLGTAIAGTVLRYQTFGTAPDQVLHGIRSAAYFGISISALGLFLSFIGVLISDPVQGKLPLFVKKHNSEP